MSKKEKYYIHPRLDGHKSLIIRLDNEQVDLKGNDSKSIIAATKGVPERILEIRGATQTDLKRLYEHGDNGGGIYKNKFILMRVDTPSRTLPSGGSN